MLYRASGGPYGGIYVDKEYLKMHETIFGEGAIDQLKTEDMVEFLTTKGEFEVKKRTAHESRCSNFISRLSIVLNDKLNNDEKMKKAKSSYLKDQVTFIKDKITLSQKLMKSSLTIHYLTYFECKSRCRHHSYGCRVCRKSTSPRKIQKEICQLLNYHSTRLQSRCHERSCSFWSQSHEYFC